MRRSIVAAKPINKGCKIEREDLVFKRPGTGIPPDQYLDIIGKIAIRNIQPDELINFDDIR
jgi:sialic acid synthase SpsE